MFDWLIDLLERWGLWKKKKKKKKEPELEDFPVEDPEVLWKPGGEETGEMVALFPSEMPNKDIKDKWKFKPGTQFITDAAVCRNRDGSGVIEDLGVRKTHISEPEEEKTDKLNPNGNRVHARAGKHGGHYGNDIFLVAYWENFDGTLKGTRSWFIPEGAGRWEGTKDPLRRTG